MGRFRGAIRWRLSLRFRLPCFATLCPLFSGKYDAQHSQGVDKVLDDNWTLKPQITGNIPLLRSLMTMGQQELSSGHERSVVSHETSQPQRIKLKRLDKTAKHIMNILDNKAVDKVRTEREIPDIRPGYIVQLKVEVPENKRRTSIIKGIVIARRNASLNTT